MNYNRSALRAQVVSVLDAWDAHHADQEKRARADYERKLARWEKEHKEEVVAEVAATLKAAKASKPFSLYTLRSNVVEPPSEPKPQDCCTPTTQVLRAFVELIDTITDEHVSSSALSQAGFKDLSRLLRRPC